MKRMSQPDTIEHILDPIRRLVGLAVDPRKPILERRG
jgi:hypothetical protein